MFFSEEYKIMWWQPPRIASRALSCIPKTLNFDDQKNGHTLTVVNKEWDVFHPTRNPYSRTVSWWNLRYNEIIKDGPKITYLNFEQFVKMDNNEYFRIESGHTWDVVSTLKNNNMQAKYVVRYEHLIDDLMKLDFIKDNFEILKNNLYDLKYTTRNSYRNRYSDITKNPICSFYTQELADIVWQEKQYEFEEWGYERDSWKTLL
jgi:hypothetical protein